MTKQTRNLVLFFGLTFLWTWAFYAPIVITGSSPYEMPGMILLILGGAGPTVVGLGLVFFTYAKDQRRDYWRRVLSLKRISLLWWAVILLIFPVITALSTAVALAAGGSAPGMELFQDVIANPLTLPSLVLLWFMSGPVSEEFGWRGYALDPIISRFGLLRGSITLGLIWGVWHLPLFFMPATWHGEVGFKFAGFWTFVIFNVGLALIMTWVYKRTDRSILSALCLHMMSNFTANLILPSSEAIEIVRALLLLAVGVIAVVLTERSAQNRVQGAVERAHQPL